MKYPEGFVRWTETENLAESVRLMSAGLARRLNVADLTTHTFAIENADQAYALVLEKTDPHMGILLTYPDVRPAEDPITFPTPQSSLDECVIGLIGAGQFARSILLPELMRQPGVTLHTIVSKGSASTAHSGEKFGFGHASTDANSILKNPAINAVIIASRHDDHSAHAVAALNAGKSVLVEKPLGLNRSQIEAVQTSRANARGFFRSALTGASPLWPFRLSKIIYPRGSRFMTFRINAGSVPGGSWLHNMDEGGGRIVGELCHFIDLARYFAGAISHP